MTPRSPASQPNGEPRKEKEYCTYWLFHGECAFTHSAKGCKFKHEMPQDAKTMAEVGLKGPPKWWLDKTRGAHMSTDWRTNVTSRRRSEASPIQRHILTPRSGISMRFLETPASARPGPIANRAEQAKPFTTGHIPPGSSHSSMPSMSSRIPLAPTAPTAPAGFSEGISHMIGHSFRSTPAPAPTPTPTPSVRTLQGNRVHMHLSRHNSFGDSSEEDLVTFG